MGSFTTAIALGLARFWRTEQVPALNVMESNIKTGVGEVGQKVDALAQQVEASANRQMEPVATAIAALSRQVEELGRNAEVPFDQAEFDRVVATELGKSTSSSTEPKAVAA